MLLVIAKSHFPLGQIVITPNALSLLAAEDINDGLRRHASLDWGNVCPDDAALNDQALTNGDRLLSAYGDGPGRFWIITESDRSATTILMPDDY